jgi:ferredoxin
VARFTLLRPAVLDGTDADRRFETMAAPLDSVLVAFEKSGIPLRHDCGGKALCGSCRVRLAEAGLRGLGPLGERERERLAALGEAADGSVRLACQLRSLRDLELVALLPTGSGAMEAT